MADQIRPARASFKGWCLLACCCIAVSAWADQPPRIFVGPVYSLGPETVGVLVEGPYDAVRQDAARFKLLVDDLPIASAHERKPFQAAGKALDWIICLDVGRISAPLLKEAKTTLRSFVERQPQPLRAALLTAGSSGRLASPLSTGSLKSQIEGLKLEGAGGGAPLGEVIELALDSAQGSVERRRILIIWAGKDETDEARLQDIARRALDDGVRVDVVALGIADPAYRDRLQEFAERTGGYYLFATPGAVRLSDALGLIEKRVWQDRAVLTYFQVSPERLQGKSVGVSLEPRSGPALRGMAPRDPRLSTPHDTSTPATPTPDPEVLKTSPDPAGSDDGASGFRPAPGPWPWSYWLLGVALTALVASLAYLLVRRLVLDRDDGGQAVVRPEVPERREPSFFVPEPTPKFAEPPPSPPRHTQVGGYFPAPAPGRPIVVLVGLTGLLQGRRFPMTVEMFRLGADAGNELAIPGDSYVSAHHAVLRYEQGSLFIIDQGSRNGTFVNAQRVAESARVLMPGDVIQLGESRFELSLT